jgi:DNA-binding MarR family transcriptional regulator
MAKVKRQETEPALHPPTAEMLAVADRLHSAAIHLLRRIRRQDVSSGVGPAQLSALSVLVFVGPRTLGELASAEQVKPPTMSRIIAGLKRSHLVSIAHDQNDGRRMSISATPQGVQLLQRGRQLRIEYLASHLGALTSVELGRLSSAADTLEKLLRHWHEA